MELRRVGAVVHLAEVLGFDLAVAAFGALRLVAGALDLESPLLKRLIVVGLERLGGDQCRLHARGVSATNSAPATASSIRPPPTRRHQPPRPSATTAPRQW